jgi:hypothetical protein
MSSAGAVLQASLAQAGQAFACGDAAGAQRAYAQAHLLAPQDPEILLNWAAACLAGDEPAQALVHAQAAAQQTQGWRLQMVLATASKRLNHADAAAQHLQAALAEPDLPAGLRGSALRERADVQLNAFGDARGAAVTLQAAADLNPALVLEAELAGLVADLYEGHRRAPDLAARFAALAGRLQAPVSAPTGPRRTGRTRLRIGLLSQQFCASPVGFLTLGAITALARQADLLFFDRGAKADWAQTAFKASARQWVSCAGVNAAQLHRLLAEADLDAVIDLSGWTDPQALSALVGRPAPRQLKWVGGQSLSTGLRCFDGFVADTRQVPPAAAKLYTEPLLYARHGYVSYTAPPYAPELDAAAARPPKPTGRPAQGVFALVSNPAKISAATADALRRLRPRKLVLVDQRWRHEGTRRAAEQRLGGLLDVAEFITPANHPDYLQALRALDASFIDTAPYAMGLTAIELSLLGKHIVAAPRSPTALMCERHCVAHLDARRFDHHTELAAQLLAWCRP